MTARVMSNPPAEDTYRRDFDGDTAQCGCRWVKDSDFGDVLLQCKLHQAATEASVRRFERERGQT